MANLNLDVPVGRKFIPLLAPARYKGGRGGRASGKSHFFAERMVIETVVDPNQSNVCLREIQKDLTHSAKKLIETKIRDLGVQDYFDVLNNEIRRRAGDGLFIFQGLRDQTADSIKSLEGFKRAWVEEGQNTSAKSWEILIPTIRAPGSEIWASWNPENETDPIEQFFCGPNKDPDAICVTVNYTDNPFLPPEMAREAEKHRVRNPQTFGHVWLGEYATISEAQIFKGKYKVEAFTPGKNWDGPYFGLDFGFSTDPTAAVKAWIHEERLFVEYDASRAGLELDDTAEYLNARIPVIGDHTVRADNARPESISYLARHGLPFIVACEKGKGSVEDGIEHIKSYKEIVIHPRCEALQREAREYRYRIDRLSGDILPEIEDKNNHCWDALRYALEPIMKSQQIDYSKLI